MNSNGIGTGTGTKCQYGLRNRIVRQLVNTDTEYVLEGFFLDEKFKRKLRGAGVKREDEAWYSVYKNLDVLYTFNTRKKKMEVFVGVIKSARYRRSGKTRRFARLLDSNAQFPKKNTRFLIRAGEVIRF